MSREIVSELGTICHSAPTRGVNDAVSELDTSFVMSARAGLKPRAIQQEVLHCRSGITT